MCDYCDAAFADSGSAKSARARTHTGEKLYKCDARSRAFVSASDLAKHNFVRTWYLSWGKYRPCSEVCDVVARKKYCVGPVCP